MRIGAALIYVWPIPDWSHEIRLPKQVLSRNPTLYDWNYVSLPVGQGEDKFQPIPKLPRGVPYALSTSTRFLGAVTDGFPNETSKTLKELRRDLAKLDRICLAGIDRSRYSDSLEYAQAVAACGLRNPNGESISPEAKTSMAESLESNMRKACTAAAQNPYFSFARDNCSDNFILRTRQRFEALDLKALTMQRQAGENPECGGPDIDKSCADSHAYLSDYLEVPVCYGESFGTCSIDNAVETFLVHRLQGFKRTPPVAGRSPILVTFPGRYYSEVQLVHTIARGLYDQNNPNDKVVVTGFNDSIVASYPSRDVQDGGAHSPRWSTARAEIKNIVELSNFDAWEPAIDTSGARTPASRNSRIKDSFLTLGLFPRVSGKQLQVVHNQDEWSVFGSNGVRAGIQLATTLFASGAERSKADQYLVMFFPSGYPSCSYGKVSADDISKSRDCDWELRETESGQLVLDESSMPGTGINGQPEPFEKSPQMYARRMEELIEYQTIFGLGTTLQRKKIKFVPVIFDSSAATVRNFVFGKVGVEYSNLPRFRRNLNLFVFDSYFFNLSTGGSLLPGTRENQNRSAPDFFSAFAWSMPTVRSRRTAALTMASLTTGAYPCVAAPRGPAGAYGPDGKLLRNELNRGDPVLYSFDNLSPESQLAKCVMDQINHRPLLMRLDP